MKWDKTKKRYTLQKVDREGKIMKEAKNESGKKISKAMAMKHAPDAIYTKWQQRSHLSLQKAGEQENVKLISQARSANESRHMMKTFRGSHKDLDKGEDMRNPKLLMKAKEKKLAQKMKNLSKDDRKSNRVSSVKEEKFIKGGRSFSQKAKNKIIAGMRPTRAKVILKGGGKDAFANKRNKSGGRGGRQNGRGR